jgi:hypothetical protein
MMKLLITILFSVLIANLYAQGDSSHAEVQQLKITSLKEGWKTLGLRVKKGAEVTISAKADLKESSPLPLEARHSIWVRVGKKGKMFQLASNDHTFTSQERGEIFVAVNLDSKSLWKDEYGNWTDAFELIPDTPIDVLVTGIVWPNGANAGLGKMKISSDSNLAGIATRAISGIENKRSLPEGFKPLWYLGQSNIFEAYNDAGRKGVRVSTNDDYGIIKKPLDIPLNEETRINFNWCYKKLPATMSEIEVAGHDYISIAVEFDNGSDITWMWSREIIPETSFHCPLNGWQDVETHIVLQSGYSELGKWFSHERQVKKDYESAVGGEVPSRIVGVWIIGNAVFGRQEAEAIFTNIQIVNKSEVIDIFE